ncbi:hypothetical protein LJH26_004275 [Salmonella enterica]|nr:hypothetical protein [Salmonella enterica]
MSIILEKVHVRLVEELKRVGPLAVAKSTGISRATIYNWIERGNTPLDKLALLDSAGVDVTYILTGQRIPGLGDEKPSLTSRQAALLDNYDNLNDSDKRALERTAFALAEQGKLSKKEKAAS